MSRDLYSIHPEHPRDERSLDSNRPVDSETQANAASIAERAIALNHLRTPQPSTRNQRVPEALDSPRAHYAHDRTYLLRDSGEPRPSLRFGAQVGSADRLACPEAVQTGTLVVLQLEQFEQPDRFAGGGHHPKLPARVGEEQPCRRHVEQLDAAISQHVQEVDHVEISHHRVGQLDERFRKQLSVHPVHLFSSGNA